MTTEEQVLAILKRVTETDEVVKNRDVRVYDLDLLDSFKTVELIVALSEELSVEISPAEFEREEWATPRMIVRNVVARLAACESA